MKKIILVLFIGLLASCQPDTKLTNAQRPLIKKEINTLLDNWHKDAANADFKPYFNALDSSSVFVGTDPEEVWNKKQFSTFSKPFFDRGTAWSFTALKRNIYFSNTNDVVWFDEVLDTWMGLSRGSGVVEKTADGWKIKHYVLSVAIPNDDINEVVKITKEKDSIYRQKIKRSLN